MNLRGGHDAWRAAWPVLLAVLLAALVLRMVTWWALPNIHHPDEVFQYQEQSYLLLHGYGVQPWDVQPQYNVRWGVLTHALAALRGAGELAFGQAAGPVALALGMSLLSLVVVFAAWCYGHKHGGVPGAMLASGVAAVWYELVYFAPKTMTGPIGGHLAVLAILLLGLGLDIAGRKRLIAGGAVLALAVLVRVQMGPALLVVFVCLWIARGWKAAGWTALGGAAVLTLAAACDVLMGDIPFGWIARYVHYNVTEGVAAMFGTEPGDWYLRQYVVSWRWLAVPIVLLAIVGLRRMPAAAACAVATLLVHSAIAHKEYRFVIVTVMLGLLIAGVGAAVLLRAAAVRWGWSWRGQMSAVLTVVLLAGLAGLVRSTDYPYNRWWRSCSSTIEAYRYLREQPDLRALALRAGWPGTPGYAELRRDVPMTIYDSDEELLLRPGRYTHVVSWEPMDERTFGLSLVGRWEDGFEYGRTTYVYRSTLPFAGPPDVTINDQLDWPGATRTTNASASAARQ